MKTFLVFLFWSLLPLVVKAQSIASEIVATSGSNYGNGNIAVSWTVGDLAISYLTGSGYSVSQGFQQGFLSGTGNRVSQNIANESLLVELPTSGIRFFPNPVTEQFFIDFGEVNMEDYLSISMTSSIGVLLERRSINGEKGIISLMMKEYASGVYYLKIDKKNGSTVIKKIVKY